VLDGMYPSRPRWEFLALNFFGMMLAIAMLTERTVSIWVAELGSTARARPDLP
jgi:hypothetical protein